jgi:excisionase family DNA binding protein
MPDAQSPLTLDAAAKRLGVSRRTLERHIAADTLPHLRVGHLVRVPVDVVDAILVGRLELPPTRRTGRQTRNGPGTEAPDRTALASLHATPIVR